MLRASLVLGGSSGCLLRVVASPGSGNSSPDHIGDSRSSRAALLEKKASRVETHRGTAETVRYEWQQPAPGRALPPPTSLFSKLEGKDAETEVARLGAPS
ncbi:MAG: hypothetical protein V3U31_02290 [Dehalococcoidia bacterium]